MNDEELRKRRARAVRTALLMAAIALAFFVGSFFFLTD